MDFKLNKTSKMNCFSFSLDARNCVTGSKLRKIKGSTCSTCYALKGNYNYPSVIKNRQNNLGHFESVHFVNVMTFKLQDQKFFRWFDSGDIPHMEGLEKIVQIAINTPWCKHWLPSRELKLIDEYEQQGGTVPKNLVVRVSAPMIDGQPPKGFQNTSTVHTKNPIGFECPSVYQDNNCGSCRACWDKRIKNISYRAH